MNDPISRFALQFLGDNRLLGQGKQYPAEEGGALKRKEPSDRPFGGFTIND